MRPADVRTAALAFGTVLLLIAALAPFLPGSSVLKRGGTWARASAAIAGVALLGWGVSSFLGPQVPAGRHPVPPPYLPRHRWIWWMLPVSRCRIARVPRHLRCPTARRHRASR